MFSKSLMRSDQLRFLWRVTLSSLDSITERCLRIYGELRPEIWQPPAIFEMLLGLL